MQTVANVSPTGVSGAASVTSASFWSSRAKLRYLIPGPASVRPTGSFDHTRIRRTRSSCQRLSVGLSSALARRRRRLHILGRARNGRHPDAERPRAAGGRAREPRTADSRSRRRRGRQRIDGRNCNAARRAVPEGSGHPQRPQPRLRVARSTVRWMRSTRRSSSSSTTTSSASRSSSNESWNRSVTLASGSSPECCFSTARPSSWTRRGSSSTSRCGHGISCGTDP